MKSKNNTDSDPAFAEITAKLDAILAVLVLGLPPEQESKKGRKIEVILAECGVPYASIAAVTGKGEAAVRKALSRARNSKK